MRTHVSESTLTGFQREACERATHKERERDTVSNIFYCDACFYLLIFLFYFVFIYVHCFALLLIIFFQ